MAGTRVSAPLRSSRLRRGRNGDTCQNNWHTGVSNLPRKTAEDGRKNRGVASSGPLLGLDPLQPADRAVDEPRCSPSFLFPGKNGEEFVLMDRVAAGTVERMKAGNIYAIVYKSLDLWNTFDRIMLTRALLRKIR